MGQQEIPIGILIDIETGYLLFVIHISYAINSTVQPTEAWVFC